MVSNISTEAKILIADDSEFIGLIINNFLNRQKHIRVIGMVKNVKDIYSLIAMEIPDIIILNSAILHAEDMNLIEQIAAVVQNEINIIVLSNKNLEFYARELGAQYCMAIPVDLDDLHVKILEMLLDMGKIGDASAIKNASTEKRDEMIKSMLFAFGIPGHLKGYRYLFTAIKMVVISPHIINNITNILYPLIAENFHSTSIRVERGMRYAIEFAWKGGYTGELNDLFGYDISNNKKPTNGQFIALVAAKFE